MLRYVRYDSHKSNHIFSCAISFIHLSSHQLRKFLLLYLSIIVSLSPIALLLRNIFRLFHFASHPKLWNVSPTSSTSKYQPLCVKFYLFLLRFAFAIFGIRRCRDTDISRIYICVRSYFTVLLFTVYWSTLPVNGVYCLSFLKYI